MICKDKDEDDKVFELKYIYYDKSLIEDKEYFNKYNAIEKKNDNCFK